MQQIFDVIIIGAGASGLFSAIESPFLSKKLILEKNKSAGIKVLLSGGERANVTNIDINPLKDYFGENKKALLSIFKKYSNYDFISFLSENNINLIEEDRGRMILESGNSKQIVDLLVKKALKNNTEIKYNSSVVKINPPVLTDIPLNKGDLNKGLFEVILENNQKYYSKKLVISTGGKSYPQVGTTGDGYEFATSFGHKIINPYRGLSSIVTIKDLSEISGVSCNLKLELYSKTNDKKIIYSEFGPLLFTHFGISGPIVYNTSLAIGESGIDIKDLSVKLTFDLENLPKKLIKFFELTQENNTCILDLQELKSWKESKVTGGGVCIDELTNNLESKFINGLYFTGEILDLTGKTGGYNLQLCWSTGSVVGKNL